MDDPKATASDALDFEQFIAEPPAVDRYAERILDAAQQQVLEFGLRRTTLEDIARQAGVNRVTIYRRFGDRDGLAMALLRRQVRLHFESLAAAVDDSDDPHAWIVEGFVHGATMACGDPLLRRLLSTDAAAAEALVRLDGPVMAIALRFVHERIERMQATESAAAGDASALAEAGMRIIHSLALDPNSRLPLDRPDALRAFARRALVPMITGTATADGGAIDHLPDESKRRSKTP